MAFNLYTSCIYPVSDEEDSSVKCKIDNSSYRHIIVFNINFLTNIRINNM